jgi:alpha-1,4-N-acetylglucosaminyltransferase EXTL3
MLALFYKLKDNNYGRFLLLLLCLLAVMPFVTHYYLTKRSGSHSTYFESFHTRSTLQDDGNSEYKLDELRKNIYELEHVKLSLKNELRELEGKRHGLLRNIQEHSNNIDSIRNKAGHLTNEVSKRQQELEDLRFAKQMVDRCPQLPLVKPPKDIFSKLSNSFRVFPKVTAQERNHCKLSSCFDYQKCPLGHDFAAHIYKPQNLLVIALEMYGILKSMPYAVDVSEPTACVYIVIIDKSSQSSPTELERFLYSLKFWQGDGRNHILINVAGVNLKSVDTGRAILAQTIFTQDTPYRQKFDIVLPPFASLLKYGAAWENSAPQLPANRKYLVTFEGNYHNLKKDPNNNSLISGHDLKELSLEAKDIFIQTSCRVTKEFAEYNGWQLCQSRTSRAELLKASTFVLIIHSEHSNDQTVTMRFIEALQYGAVPVLISDDILLPFADIIDWERAAIMLHTAQFPQVHFILRTILVNDLLDIRRQGRFLWETYLSSTKSVLTSAIAVMQTRLSLPGLPAKDTHFPSVFRDGNEPVFYTPNAGVMQHRMKAATFYRNFSANTIYARQRWNTYPGALLLYPSSPFVPVLPSSAAFLNSSVDIQPIGKGAGGAGVEFQKALGGDYPFEQFTIVMLTYERELVLIEALGRLAGLQYLNKVVVIWNSPGDPSPDLKWPNIGVPVKVLLIDTVPCINVYQSLFYFVLLFNMYKL